MTPPAVQGVLLTFNGRQTISAAMAAARRQTWPVRSITVVDNASTDGGAGVIDDLADDVVLLATNEGVGAGHNAGWRKILDSVQAPDLIWALEHDTEPEEDCLEYLMRTFTFMTQRGHPVGAVVPRQKLPGEEGDRLSKHRTIYAAPRLTFNGALISVEAIRHVGELREDFFIGHEDREYASRLTAAGYVVLHDPDAIVIHRNKGRHPYRERSVLRDYYSFRNEIYLRRNLRREPFALLKLSARSAVHIVRVFLFADDRIRRSRARLRALLDGARGDLGKKRYGFLLDRTEVV